MEETGPIIFIIFASLLIFFTLCCCCFGCWAYCACSGERKNKSEDRDIDDLEITYLNDKFKGIRNSFKKALSKLKKKSLDPKKTDSSKENDHKGDDQKGDDQKNSMSNLGNSMSNLNVNDSKESKKIAYVINYSESFNEILKDLLFLNLADSELLITLNCPGGSLTDFSESVYLLEQIKSKIPITVYVQKKAASGGYMIAAISHKIIAGPFDTIGSIGVYAAVVNIKNILDTVGVTYKAHTSGKLKASGHIGNEWTDDDQKELDRDLKNIHFLFKEVVSKHRPGCKIEECSDGNTFMGKDAIEKGLIDGIGNFQDYYLEHIKDIDFFSVSRKEKEGGGLLQKVLKYIPF